ncbi:hypothetical protein IYW40_11625 [Methylocystis sp. H4A]|uniref:hypothetical protein n=1 Tax=Methylocystis sp. H4A TaxID=2785788 RepID=UPI0018C3329D|nr:hypothetical protein [Methylocystis sp. H4A]MBG0802123.1 hypothetical protein [Methylocystis sp. H4A]
MAETLREIEGAPASYPASGISPEPSNAAVVWQRCESYIAYRWTPRTIEWVAEGPGHWVPPLAPATISTTEWWNGSAWEAATIPPSPLGGYDLPGCALYRFTGTVGGGTAPAIVLEAFKRLSAYMLASSPKPGVASVTAGSVSIAYRGDAWTAKAMQDSGASDLLRKFRRAA